MVVMDRAYDALLCDVDGVVRHWDRTIAGLEQEYGLSAGTFAAVAFAPDRLMPAVTGRISDEEWRADVARGLTDHCGSAERAARFVQLWSEPVGRIDDEVLQLLVGARRSIPVALVSNATTRLERDLEVLGVIDVVPCVVNSARVGAAKPDPAIYRAAAERVGVPAGRCLFVDDTPENVHAARALGMTGLVYRELAELRAALRPVLA
jgi:putative hydrolase of the HAD superfamily